MARLEQLEGNEINAAKVVLANEVTRMVRGEEAARKSEETAATTFGALKGSTSLTLTATANLTALPTLSVPAEGIRLAQALTDIGFTASNGEAKRKIAEGAVRIDDRPVTDPAYLIELAPGSESRLSLGKKRHGVLRSV